MFTLSLSQIITHTSSSILAPSSAPHEISAQAISSTRFTITWLPPLEDDVNGIITGYTVLIYEVDTNTTNIYNTTYANITLSSLHPFYSYQCYVAGSTVAAGPFSDPVIIKTLQTGMTHLQ